MTARILVVDDQPANVALLDHLLEAHGYEVCTAGDATGALAMVSAARPDLILMDLQLPGMSGYELTRRLKGNPDTADIVVIAVTSYAMAGDRDKALAAGCDDHVAKPIDTRALPRLVADFLSRRPLPAP